MPTPTFFQPQLFTNRIKATARFEVVLDTLQPDEHRLLAWSGLGGQGKTALLEAFERILKKRADPDIGYALVDFENGKNREISSALLTIREQLYQTAGLHFPLFEFACLRYLAMTQPNADLKDLKADFFSTGSEGLDAFLQALNEMGEFGAAVHVMPGFSLITKYGTRLLAMAGQTFNTWWNQRGIRAFADIDELSQNALLRRLPHYFAADLTDALAQEYPPRVVIMLDAYEALWRDHGLKSGPGALGVDDWVRSLVQNAPGVMFVVAGRHELQWHKSDKTAGWDRVIEKHSLNGLTRPHSQELLLKWGVVEPEIQERIIYRAYNQELGSVDTTDDKTEAYLPYYLELQANTYSNIKARGTSPKPEDFDIDQPQILARFLHHLDDETEKLLRVASYLYTLDPELLEFLSGKFLGGRANVDWSRLYGRGLFFDEPEGKRYFHNLLHTALQEYEKTERPTLYRDIHEALFEWFDAQWAQDSLKTVTADQERAVLSAIRHLSRIDEQKAVRWANAQMQKLKDAERWRSLEEACQLVLPFAQDFDAESELTLAILAWLADAASSNGRYDDAEALLEGVRTVKKKTLGAKNPSTVTTLHELANVYRNNGRYVEAERLYKRVLVNYRKSHDPEHRPTVTALLGLVGVYSDTGRYAQAEKLCESVLRIEEKNLDLEDPGTATTLANLAGVYSDTGRYADAETLFKRAHAIYENTLDPEHPSTAAMLHNLAGVYSGTGRYLEAETLFKRVREVYEENFGPEHPRTATTLANLAGVYSDTGRYAEAEELFKLVRKVYEKTLSPEHPRTATTLASLVGVYRDARRYTEAEPLCKRIREIDKKTLGPEHPWAATMLTNLAGVCSDTGRYLEAETLLKRVSVIDQKNFEPEHPWTATTLYNLASVYRDSKRYSESTGLFETAWEVLSKKLPPRDPKIARFRVQRGKLYALCDKKQEATADFTEALSIFEAVGVVPEHRWMREARDGLEKLQRL